MGNNDSETLYVQEIEDSHLLIVDYSVWYGRDGHIAGRTLMKTINDFNFRDIENLPLDYIIKLEADKINSVKLIKSDNEIDISNEIRKKNFLNTQILSKYYFRGYDTPICMLNRYSFDSFIETKDSLFLSGIKREYGNNYKDMTEVRIKKGNIKIISDSTDNVIRLEITDLNIMGNLACLTTSYMIPSTKINESEFSKFGFFKKVKK